MADSSHDFDASARPASQVTLQVNDQLDQFRIAEQVATSATSTLFRGYDDLLNREVIVRQIHLSTPMAGSVNAGGGTELSEDEQLRKAVTAITQQQKKLAETYPRFWVQIMDVISEPRGLFIISQCVRGQPLDIMFSKLETAMDTKQALGIIAATALALDPVHQSGQCHAALKPANVLLPQDGGLKISDLGLAPVIDPQYALRNRNARYVAPEIFRGEPATPQSDFYAMGMMMLELLAGQRAFDEAFSTITRDQRNEPMRWMKWATHQRTTAPTLATLRPDLSPALSELVARMVAKSPTARISRAGDLIEAIRRHYVEAGQEEQAAKLQAQWSASQSATAANLGAGAVAGVNQGLNEDEADEVQRGKWLKVAATIAAIWIVVVIGIAGYWQWYQGQQQQEQLAAAMLHVDAAKDLLEDLQDEDDSESGLQNQNAANEAAIEAALLEYEQAMALLPPSTEEYQSVKRDYLQLQHEQAMLNAAYGVAREVADEALAAGVVTSPVGFELKREAEINDAFARGTAEIRSFIDTQGFDDARQLLRGWQDVHLTEAQGARQDERAILDALWARLLDQERQLENQQLIAQAEALIAQGRRDAAFRLLRPALLESPSPQLRDYFAQVDRERQFDEAVKRGDDAANTGRLDRLDTAAAAYREALAIRADPEVRQKLNEVAARQSLRRGEQLMQQGRMAQAAAAFQESLDYAYSEQAMNGLKDVQQSQSRAAYIQAGDEALRRNEFAQALRHYQAALNFGIDDTLQERIEDAQIQQFLFEGENELLLGNIQAALERYQRALLVNPEHAETQNRISELQLIIDYRKHLEAADEARARSDFGEAKREYRKAQAIVDTEEVQQRIEDTEFDQLMAQARSYIEVQEFAAARSLLMQAQRIRGTPEILRLMEICNNALSS